MAIKPVVRYMLLCEDWRLDPSNNRRIIIVGLLSNIHALEEPPFPLLYREMCVFLALTDGHGQGEGKIVCMYEATGQKVFETHSRPIAFGADPLRFLVFLFGFEIFRFPEPASTPSSSGMMGSKWRSNR